MTISSSVPTWAFENHRPFTCVGKIGTSLSRDATLPPLGPPLFRGVLNGGLFIQFALIRRLLGCCLWISSIVLSGLALCLGHL